MDLIDREKLLKELKISADHHENNSRDYVLMLRDRNIVREQPTVDAQPTTKNDLAVSSELEKNSKKLEKNFGELDCILRADVNRLICEYRDDATETGNERDLERAYGANAVGELISELPSVTPQEPKTGHWIERHDDWGNGIITDRRYKCSVCHGKHTDPETGEWHEVFDYKYPFCPNCGAKMVEPQESEEEDGSDNQHN